MASVLTVPITYFYEGVADMLKASPLAVQEDGQPPELPTMDTEALELVSMFQKISDPTLRKSLLNTIRAAAASSEKADS